MNDENQEVIKLGGSANPSELDARSRLKESILELWPDIEKNKRNSVWIISGAQCHNEKPSDVDFLIILDLDEDGLPIIWSPSDSKKRERIYIKNLVLTIELKDHSGDRVRSEGNEIKVLRKGQRWEHASSQSRNQKFSVINYVRNNTATKSAPFVESLLWLQNVPRYGHDLKLPEPNDTFCGPANWQEMLNKVINSSQKKMSEMPRSKDGYYKWEPVPDRSLLRETADIFTAEFMSTNLDRHRIELINNPHDLIQEKTIPSLGGKMIAFRGKAGTGKTIRLLQTAQEAREREGARSLILTYNRALKTDLARLMALQRIGNAGTKAIRINTVMSHVGTLIGCLGLDGEFGEDYTAYDEKLQDAVSMIKGGAVTGDDINGVKEDHPGEADWDYVFIDESQDCYELERDFLVAFYGHQNILVSHGVGQLTRLSAETEWNRGLKKSQVNNVPLIPCRRMKSGLVSFANSIAFNLGIQNWRLTPSAEVPGGRVIVIEGEYSKYRSFHQDLLDQNSDDGNMPIDALFCVTSPRQVFPTQQKWNELSKALTVKGRLSGIEALPKIGALLNSPMTRSINGDSVVIGFEYPENSIQMEKELEDSLVLDEVREIMGKVLGKILNIEISKTAIPPISFPKLLQSWDSKIWDGTNELIRDTYPTNNDQLRVVDYNSCRGLEGWVAVNLRFDDYFDRTTTNSQGPKSDSLLQLMIPLTRAIDTMVINVDERQSEVKTALEKTASELQGIVEWKKTPS